MGSEKRRIIEWESLSRLGKVVMVVMLPIFAVVAGMEHVIAKLTGATYNEVNIIVYYLLIPLSWAAHKDAFSLYHVCYSMDCILMERSYEISRPL